MSFCDDILLFDIVLRHRERPILHAHDNHEFFLCVGGEGEQHTEAGVVACSENDLFLFPEGQPHIGNGSKDGDCHAIVLNIRERDLMDMLSGDGDALSLLSDMKSRAFKGGNRIQAPGAALGLIRSDMTEALDEMRLRSPGCSLAVKTHIQRMLLVLLRSVTAGAARRHAEARGRGGAGGRMAQLMKYLESNYMGQIDIDQAARMAGLSRSHFHVAFRRAAGCAFVAHLTKLRTVAAKKWLAETDLPAPEIARLCGFDSTSRFYAAIKKATGKNPRELRSHHPPS